jgi:phosphotransacetylase
MRKPVTVLSQNSSVETIVHMAAITVATNGKMSRDKNAVLTP